MAGEERPRPSRDVCNAIAVNGAKLLAENLVRYNVRPRVLVFVLDVEGETIETHLGMASDDPTLEGGGSLSAPFPWEEFRRVAATCGEDTCFKKGAG